MAAFSKLGNKIWDYFIKGLFIWGPIAVSIFLLWKFLEFLDTIIPVKIPGVGIILLFLIIIIMGYLGDIFIGRLLKKFIENMIVKLPVISVIYDMLKNLSSIISGGKKLGEPIIVILSKNPEILKPGFLIGQKNSMCIVFLPHSYNYSGNLFVVPEDLVIKVSVPAGKWLQIIASGGIIQRETIENLVQSVSSKNT